MGAGSAQEFLGGHQRSYTGGGSSYCFVDHFAQEIFNSLLGVVYFLVNEGGSSWMVVSLHGRLWVSWMVGFATVRQQNVIHMVSS